MPNGWIEPTSWLLLGMTALLLMQQYPKEKEMHKVGRSPSAEHEVDPTRWRHDGTQPYKYTGYGHGNARPVVDLATRDALHNFSLIGAWT